MKRMTALILALILCLSLLTACSGGAAVESPDHTLSADLPDVVSEPVPEPSEAPSRQPSDEQSDPPESPSQPLQENLEPTLSLSQTDVTLTYPGYVLKLTPAFAGFGTGSTALSWSSSDDSVAAVDQEGNVTSVSPGKAVITAETYTGVQAVCIIRCRWTEETPAPDVSSPAESPAPAQPAAVDLAAFAETILNGYEFSGFLQLADPSDELGSQLLTNFYPGLTDLTLEQSLIYVNGFSMNNGEFALVQAGSADDAADAAAILQARVDAMIDGGAWYPEPTRIWTEYSRVVTNGNYVMMVVHEQCDDIVNAFNALF